jgi:NitT/TauT family transport system permease protein
MDWRNFNTLAHCVVNHVMNLFELRGTLTRTQSLLLGVAGLVLFIIVWWIAAETLAVQRPIVDGYTTRIPTVMEAEELGIDRDSLLRADSIRFENATTFTKVYPILPTPLQVVQAFPELVQEDNLFKNTLLSIWRNLQGYFWAVLISIPLGFLIGLIPLFRGLFGKQVDALRYLPLTALVGIFITWFGIGEGMKISFLAFGIIVYLLPVVIQRIFEVQDVYLRTVFTLGANKWQTIKSVYIPSVMSKLIDDIRVLTAISWTYIIIAELLNQEGGVGALIYTAGRRGQIPNVFAILIVIILIGFLQDRLFVYLDQRLFSHKYNAVRRSGSLEVNYGIYILLGSVVLYLLLHALLGSLELATGSILQYALFIILVASLVMIAFGEWRVWQDRKLS